MKVDAKIDGPLASSGRLASSLEDLGFDGAWTSETASDPFLPLALASVSTRQLELGTGIAVAFARNPMLLAHLAWDLQGASHGRFTLGLGSQVRAHITRRFSMPWERPVDRMREMVLAIRAIWDSWLTGAKLDFRGDLYAHTLMTPFFSPEPEPLQACGVPKILVAAVGARMTEAAAAVADGLICHSFTTRRYLEEVTLQHVRDARRDRAHQPFEISLGILTATCSTDEEMQTAVDSVRRQLAFYASTPAYLAVLELHGWGDLQPELAGLARQGRWDQMTELITDDVLHEIAIVDRPGRVAERVYERYGDLAQRVNFYAPYQSDLHVWGDIASQLRALSEGGSSTTTV